MRFSSIVYIISIILLSACTTSRPTTGGTKPRPTQGSVDTGAIPQGISKSPVQTSTGPTRYRAIQDAPEVGRFYQNARRLYDQGNSREALVQMKKYHQATPQGQFVDEAAFLLAKDAFDNNDFETASNYYLSIADMDPPSKLRGDSLFLSALSQYNLGKRREALGQLAKLDFRELSPGQKPKVFPFWGKAASEEGRWLEATLAFIKARKESADEGTRAQIESLVEEQVESRLNEAELNFILQEYPSQYPSPQIQMRMVSLKLASGKRSEAQELLMSIIASSQPGSPTQKKATDLMNRLRSLGDAQGGRIGALLPLSGNNAELGRAVLEGLQFALNGTQGIEVVQADVGPTEETAASAFERLVFEDRVMAVVGPLSGKQAEVIATKSAELGIPYVALSARPGLLDKGPFVFRLALTPERQVRALVGYAKEKLGAKRFAILFPQDSFGREFAMEYIQAAEDFDGEVTAMASYDPKQSDFRLEIENLVGTGFPRFRATEFKDNVEQLKTKLNRDPTEREMENLLPPIVDFDVLFIPDTYKAVGQIVPYLMYADIRSAQLMGPSTWKNQNLLKRTGQYMEKALFVDAFAPERQSKSTRDFVEKFEKSKNKTPSSLAAQGFDVGQALRLAFAQSGGAPRSRDELRSRLENLGSFDGSLGMHNWDSRREALSELQLFEVRKNNFVHLGGISIRPRRN